MRIYWFLVNILLAGAIFYFMMPVFSLSASDLQSPVSLPVLATQGKTAQDFVPVGWTTLAKAEGDLNKDAASDVVLILRQAAEAQEPKPVDVPRILTVLLKQPDQTYRLSVSSTTIVFCQTCGGVLGDPFQELSYVKGTFVVQHYGGSNWRWEYTHRYRFQDREWYLIGITQSRSWALYQVTSDANLNTGDVIYEQYKEDKKTENRQKLALKPVRLTAVDLYSETPVTELKVIDAKNPYDLDRLVEEEIK